MQLTITPEALKELKQYIHPELIRISVVDGCCGKSFALTPLNTSANDDILQEFDGLKIATDPASAKIAPIVTIDIPGPIDGFMVTNVGAKGGCGCGRSFFVEE